MLTCCFMAWSISVRSAGYCGWRLMCDVNADASMLLWRNSFAGILKFGCPYRESGVYLG